MKKKKISDSLLHWQSPNPARIDLEVLDDAQSQATFGSWLYLTLAELPLFAPKFGGGQKNQI